MYCNEVRSEISVPTVNTKIIYIIMAAACLLLSMVISILATTCERYIIESGKKSSDYPFVAQKFNINM